MRLIFIRHAEPDYEHNTLTKRGFREAQLLANRVPDWKAERYYVSPLARASLTAAPSLERAGRSAEVLSWMREFSYGIHDPVTGAWQVPWDFMPQYWTNDSFLQDKDHFYDNAVLSSAPQYEPAVHALRNGLDSLLAEHGYYRKDGYYLTDDATTNGDDEKTLVFFGHLGANLEAIGYLLNISPPVLQQTIYLAPTSVSILNAEKRQPGDPDGWSPDICPVDSVDVSSYWAKGRRTDPAGRPGIAMFRAQVLGDVQHLLEAGQPISESGSFARVLNG